MSEENSDVVTAILIERIVRETYTDRRSKDIQPLQWSILRHLSDNPAEARTVQAVARALCLTTAPVSRALRTLQKRGLIRQEVNPSDGRSSISSLTKFGKAELDSDPILKVAAVLKRQPSKDRKKFREVAEAIYKEIKNKSE